MPPVDEESAGTMPTSPMEYDLVERGKSLSYDYENAPQHEQSSTPMMANHIPATPGFGRHKDAGQMNKKRPPPKLLHP